MTSYLDIIDKPHPGIVNQGLKSPSATFMSANIPAPRATYTGNCQDPTEPAFLKLVQTRSVGPFKVTGLRPAIDSLEVVLSQVKSELPDLYGILGTAGMLCCRYKRIKGKIVEEPSNHSFGTAVDIKLAGKLDPQGDDHCYRGLLVLSKYFNAARWYWGVAFPTEDAMHFEASTDLVRDWKKAGLI